MILTENPGDQTFDSVAKFAPVPGRRQWLTNLLWTLPFIAFFLVQLHHHQLWRDELNVWGIDRASPTLGMLAHYIHFEGHPGLWYYLLWIPSRIWASPAAMKGVEAVIGIGIYLYIGMASPWSRVEKVLFFLSYYISFEYTVLSRTYGLCLLFALAYVHLRTHRPQAIVWCAVLLGLMANTDMLGVMLSGALLVEYSWDRLAESRQLAISAARSLVSLWAIYLGFLVASYLTLRPANDISWATTGRFGLYLRDPRHLAVAVVSSLGLPWFPLSPHWTYQFWNPSASGHPYFFAAVSIPATAAIIFLFRKNPPLMALMGLTVLASILFAHLVYLGYMRHFGVAFMAFLVAYWILRMRDKRVSWVALALLGLSALGGLEAAIGSWNHPFSNAGNAADWLVAHHLENQPLAGFPDMMVVGVAESLGRPIYFPQCNCTDTFMLFAKRRDDLDERHLPDRLRRADQDLHTRQYTLVMIHELWPDQVAKITADHQKITPLAGFTGADEPYENFFLYTVSRTD